MKLRNNFIEPAFTCNDLLSSASIQALLTEVLRAEMISTWLKRWAEKEALSPSLYCDLTFSISVALEFLTQTRRCMCMYLLCGFWNFKVTLSVEFAAKGKDEMRGKHHVPSSLLDFPDNMPSTAAHVNWLLTGFKVQWTLQVSKLLGKWDWNTAL